MFANYYEYYCSIFPVLILSKTTFSDFENGTDKALKLTHSFLNFSVKSSFKKIFTYSLQRNLSRIFVYGHSKNKRKNQGSSTNRAN